MWIIALEALVALCLLLLIVWLTMPGSRRRDTQAEAPDESKPGKDRDSDRSA